MATRQASQPSTATDRREVAGALEAEEEGLDPGLQLARVERLGQDVVRADFEEADAVRRRRRVWRDADDGDGRQDGRGPDLPTDVRRGPIAGHHVDDDELVVAARAAERRRPDR